MPYSCVSSESIHSHLTQCENSLLSVFKTLLGTIACQKPMKDVSYPPLNDDVANLQGAGLHVKMAVRVIVSVNNRMTTEVASEINDF